VRLAASVSAVLTGIKSLFPEEGSAGGATLGRVLILFGASPSRPKEVYDIRCAEGQTALHADTNTHPSAPEFVVLFELKVTFLHPERSRSLSLYHCLAAHLHFGPTRTSREWIGKEFSCIIVYLL
jgi:hypothetical protein